MPGRCPSRCWCLSIEAFDVGNGGFAAQSHVMLAGLLHCKGFVNLHLDYFKGKHCHDRLGKLAGHVDGVWEFVNKQGLTLSPT